jgi:hypothetical protein
VPQIVVASRDPTRRAVLVFGEPGLQKETFASLIHFGSKARTGPLVQVRMRGACVHEAGIGLKHSPSALWSFAGGGRLPWGLMNGGLRHQWRMRLRVPAALRFSTADACYCVRPAVCALLLVHWVVQPGGSA